MRDFRKVRGAFVAELEPVERQVVAGVLADVALLLGAPAGPDGDPLDPAGEPGAGGAAGDGAGPAGLASSAAGPLGWSVEALPVPEDPAVRRLLPDASREDPEVAAEFRRLTEADLRATKITRLLALRRALLGGRPGWPAEALVVTPDEAPAVAATLTDVRLVLADRLGLTTDAQVDALYADLDAEAAARPRRRRAGTAGTGGDAAAEARRSLAAVYGALTYLQETLVTLLARERRR
ncbi:DUF2017 family protein [Cellulomonas endophytica]|uniref:DUF2017 family protein n=1 Tax=Cellulomonas endophytica TaxID=2494735 RepID=UPI00101108E3|nr:DUF2017 family protein [Cellulomonas endophytica]